MSVAFLVARVSEVAFEMTEKYYFGRMKTRKLLDPLRFLK
ncbi:predicted protein [Botrytis cinerea T4]|uniref:Uncharacterized protein n=1 Tax=Botryotinia fuckeliana (strain T4) TaxID=999810 RepID=G2YWS3_BOTF4|nr:predicted protein [Botrytis cinerea T4]